MGCLWSATQTIPVGETVPSGAAPKEQPTPETLRQKDRKGDGSLESGARSEKGWASTDEVRLALW